MLINKSLSNLLFPSLVGISVYLIVSKFFPEEIEPETFEKDPTNPLINIRGGNGDLKTNIIQKITKKILTDRALKISIISVFLTAGFKVFQDEIEQILLDNSFYNLYTKDVDGNLKIVCNIIEEHELASHTTAVKTLIIDKNLTHDQKINLLKIKFDSIINCEYLGSRQFLLVILLGIILSVTLSSVGGLTLILEALYRLFQEGKISKTLYKQIAKRLSKKFTQGAPA